MKLTLRLFRRKIFLEKYFQFYNVCFVVKYLVKNKIFSVNQINLKQIYVKYFTLKILVKYFTFALSPTPRYLSLPHSHNHCHA